MSTSNNRTEGRRITAQDLSERLLPDLHMNEFICWPPDLFAFTSYLLSHTGAYQLVVSPPTSKTWPPAIDDLKQWLAVNPQNILERWLGEFVVNENRSKKDRTKWVLDASEWTCHDDDGPYFGKRFISSLKRSTTISGIADHIAACAKRDLTALHLPRKLSPSVDPSSAKNAKRDDVVKSDWENFVEAVGKDWQKRLTRIRAKEFQLINHSLSKEPGNIFAFREKYDPGDALESADYERIYTKGRLGRKKRERILLGLLLKYTPPLLLLTWAHVAIGLTSAHERNSPMNVSDLLCNQDNPQSDPANRERHWILSQALLTLHAIADVCCSTWGIYSVERDEKAAQWFAERLLFDKGSLSTVNPERGRVLPKRHNPNVGITLRSLSSNLAFHRSSVEVVWRKSENAPIQSDLNDEMISMLLLPFPLEVRATDFREDREAKSRVKMPEGYSFFEYAPRYEPDVDQVIELIKQAKEELGETGKVDLVVLPEGALSKPGFDDLQFKLEKDDSPSLLISGVRESRTDIWEERKWNQLSAAEMETTLSKLSQEPVTKTRAGILGQWKEITEPVFARQPTSRDYVRNVEDILLKDKEDAVNNNLAASRHKLWLDLRKVWLQEVLKTVDPDKEVNFARNAIYCKYFNSERKTYTSLAKRHTRKFRQYKHHRWQLGLYQIGTYGLSHVLRTDKVWWEAMKIERRRVSFLNVGDRFTVSHLVCEDLARQDPIADLIRHVGPSLVVTLLMDGPQLKNRWSARYASILSDDPGSSVITLTSWGMVRRYHSPHGQMSRVIALWSESGGQMREIELANGAEAVLLTLRLDRHFETTADGREEDTATIALRLVDVIQVFPPQKNRRPKVDRRVQSHQTNT